MEGVIVHFRGSYKRKKGNQVILIVPGVASREKANDLVGKTVVWKTPGKTPKEISEQISSAHGNSGAVRALFEKGLPGQSLGTEVKIA